MPILVLTGADFGETWHKRSNDQVLLGAASAGYFSKRIKITSFVRESDLPLA